MAVEVLLPKTAKIDRTIKFTDYEAHGVGEYWLVDPTKKTVEQFVLINGVFHLRFQGGEGLLKSEVVKGFQLPAEAFFSTTPALTILQEFMN
ncbi:Uma2 family endonuclease [Larkinella sp. VNQ87]|uniref:Uma2 family endonuclease n=1 Tax=Larkinella sp. VNQ87 TaxID=3400921 RepID=UPI003C0BEBF9